MIGARGRAGMSALDPRRHALLRSERRLYRWKDGRSAHRVLRFPLVSIISPSRPDFAVNSSGLFAALKLAEARPNCMQSGQR